jgi:hypothetical protein
MRVFWSLVAGVVLLIIGGYGVWLSLSPRLEDNATVARISHQLGVGGARILMLAAAIICLLLGVYGVVLAVRGA